MTRLDDAIRGGHYAKKQILSRDWLISWSHRRRFEAGLRLARRFAGKRVLDYGCGDGTFLALLMSEATAPTAAVGCEAQARLVADCQARLGTQPGLSFLTIDELDAAAHAGAYEAVVCMEVLEHVVDLRPVLDNFERLLAASGQLLISVPVETGLPLLVKQSARRVAGWRGIGDYPGMAPYTWRELWAGLMAGRRQHISRPVWGEAQGTPFHDHKGFNWMALREELARRFEIEQTFSSPLAWLPPQLASQVWFLARKRSA
jgi:SAM-dependent methyltransferase